MREALKPAARMVLVEHRIEAPPVRGMPIVRQKVSVFVHCCNRLLGEAIARILTKIPDFCVVISRFPDAEVPSEEVMPGSVIVWDSLKALERYQQCSHPANEQGSKYNPVLVAMEEDRDHFLRAIRKGALGYVLRDASALDVVAAVRSVATGEAACPPSLARVLFDRISADSRYASHATASSKLTRREQELIPLIGNGLTNKEIAAQLNLSEETIKSHVHRILRKVGAENRRSVADRVNQSLLHSAD